LYKIETTDKKQILEMFAISAEDEIFKYKTAAREFNLIEQNTHSVIIPYDKNAQNLTGKLKTAVSPKKYLKQLQPYTINLYDNDYNILKNYGVLSIINDVAEVLTDENRYNEDEGLIINRESEALFV
jgi:hypothetical protein